MFYVCLIVMFLYGFSQPIFAVGDSLVVLESSPHNIFQKDSVYRGAIHFKNNCMSCHSLRYARNNDVLKKAGITQDMMPVWPADSWGGHPPPDLSLMAQQMGADWIYTYLHAYYMDPSRQTGFNNLVYPNTNMPNPFVSQQGAQVLLEPLGNHGESLADMHWYQVIKLHKQGKMSPAVFDNYVIDMVNFLVFVSDPSIYDRYATAPWVLGYLIVLFVVTSLVYYLYKLDAKRSDKRR